MKNFIYIGIIIALVALVGISSFRSYRLGELANNELYLAEENQELIVKLAYYQTQYSNLVDNFNNDRNELIQQIYSLQSGTTFEHGLTKAEVRSSFLESIDSICLAQLDMLRNINFCEFGYDLSISSNYVLADVGYGILFRYHLFIEEIVWEMVGFDAGLGYFHLASPKREVRYFTDEENIVLRFYRNVWNESSTEAVLTYSEVEVAGHEMWDTIVSRTAIWDLWIYGNKLYVDILPGAWHEFTFGTSSVVFGVFPLLETLVFNFPNIEEIELTFGGKHMVLDHHGSFYGTYVVGVGFVETEIFRLFGGSWHTNQN